MATKARTARRETLNMRVKAEDRSLIDRAAHLLGKSRTDFMLESARRAAQTLARSDPVQGKPESLCGVCRPPRCAASAEREAEPDDGNSGSLEINGAHGSATDRRKPRDRHIRFRRPEPRRMAETPRAAEPGQRRVAHLCRV